jgi:hypothetical protein
VVKGGRELYELIKFWDNGSVIEAKDDETSDWRGLK